MNAEARMYAILERHSKKAEHVRAAMGPQMCAVADVLRETFGAKLTWLQTPTMTVGTEPDWGVPWDSEKGAA